MEPTPYSNREIAEMFQDVRATLARIEGQTTKTNGRVNVLEGWRNWINGGMAAFAIILVPIFGWMLFKLVTLDSVVQTAVAAQLNNYVVKVTP